MSAPERAPEAIAEGVLRSYFAGRPSGVPAGLLTEFAAALRSAREAGAREERERKSAFRCCCGKCTRTAL